MQNTIRRTFIGQIWFTLMRIQLLLAVALTGANIVSAHEVRPAIADVDISASEFHMEIRLSIEPILAGINLEGLTNTDEAPEADRYDQLRALSAEDLEMEFKARWPAIAETISILVGETRLEPALIAVDTAPNEDLEAARDTTITLNAKLPDGEMPVSVGWDGVNGALVVRQMGAGEDGYSGYLTGGDLSEPLPRIGVATEAASDVFLRYIIIGFEHIIPKGLDHILFVLGLFFFSLKFKPLLLQVTAFTLAHTVTLALATLGYVQIPPEIVEPLIAASIVYVAIENIFGREMGFRRILIVFGFGLLHGLGFASVLGDIGLSTGQFITGLIAFNIGVELGQLAVIAIAFVLLAIPFGKRPFYRTWIAIPGSILIALTGAYWFFERVFL